MTQQPQPLADRIAAAFEHLDAQQWGYDHGFCGKYGTDPETDSFVNAALATVQPELDQRDAEITRLRQHVEELQDKVMSSSNGQCCCSFDGPGDVCMVHSPTVDRLRVELQQAQQQLRLIDDEIEEFEAAAQSDPNTPASVLLMIQILRRIRPAAVSGA